MAKERMLLKKLNKNRAKEFAYYIIPQMLFEVPFENVSISAKVLYGIMLSRASLSEKNGWLDEEDNTYIYMTIEACMDIIKVSNKTAVSLFNELEEIGLIERIKQGQGKPSRIYVYDFNSIEEDTNIESPMKVTKEKNVSAENNQPDLEIKEKKYYEEKIINLKPIGYDQIHDLKQELDKRGLDYYSYNHLHPFVRFVYFSKQFTYEQCVVLSETLDVLKEEYDYIYLAQGYSYSLNRLKNQKGIKSPFAYFMSILPKNIERSYKNANKEPLDFNEIIERLRQ